MTRNNGGQSTRKRGKSKTVTAIVFFLRQPAVVTRYLDAVE